MSFEKLKPGVRGGGSSLKIFDDFPSCLDDVSRWLSSQEDLKLIEPDMSPKVVSLISKQIFRISEAVHGPKARNQLPLKFRLPVRFFFDLSPGGSLCLIIKTSLLAKQELGISRLQFSERSIELFEELLGKVEACLLSALMYRKPTLYFAASFPANVSSQLKTLSRSKGATVVASDSNASHIIVPDSVAKETIDASASGDSDFLRPVGIVQTHIRAHWWYRPNSDDIWRPINDFAEEEVSDLDDVFVAESAVVSADIGARPSRRAQKFTVTARWLHDSVRFNEWMNEADYDPIDDADEISAEASGNLMKASPARQVLKNKVLESHVMIKKKKHRVSVALVSVDIDPKMFNRTHVIRLRRDANADDDDPVPSFRIIGLRIPVFSVVRRTLVLSELVFCQISASQPAEVVPVSWKAATPRPSSAAPPGAHLLTSVTPFTPDAGTRKRAKTGNPSDADCESMPPAHHVDESVPNSSVFCVFSFSFSLISHFDSAISRLGEMLQPIIEIFQLLPQTLVHMIGSRRRVAVLLMLCTEPLSLFDWILSQSSSGLDGHHPLSDGSWAAQGSGNLMNASVGNLSAEDSFPYAGPLLAATRPVQIMQSSFSVIVPIRASWFDLERIDTIERRAFPLWFKRLKTTDSSPDGWVAGLDETYRKQRNLMVLSYRVNPRIYLSATACRRMLSGDAVRLVQLHSFLESWGLLNHQVDAGTLPATVTSSGVALLNNGVSPGSSLRALFSQPASMSSFNPRSSAVNEELSSSSAVISALFDVQSSPSFRRSVYSSPAADTLRATTHASSASSSSFLPPLVGYPFSAGRSSGFVCRSCATKLKEVWYTSSSQEDYSLCKDCFASGRFSVIMSSADFIRIGPQVVSHEAQRDDDENLNERTHPSSGGASVDPADWCSEFFRLALLVAQLPSRSPAETLRLLESLEHHGEDWKSVAQFVGTKSVDECVLHFIQLPLEEPYLDASLHSWNRSCTARPFPFSTSANQMLGQVSFIAGHISPAVAASAAHAALEMLGENHFAENASVDGESGVSSGIHSSMEAIENASLASAVLTATTLAAHEQRKLWAHVTQLITLQMNKIELKLKYYETLESGLSSERDNVEIS